MACHICGNNAVGLCRQCFKFYCQEHGDGFCTDCQQQGWQLEPFTGVVARDVAGKTYASSLSLSIGQGNTQKPQEQEASIEAEGEKQEQETSAQAQGEKADVEKPPEAEVQGAGFHWHGLDQETFEALTEPSKFVSLLPIFGASRLNDVLMLVKGIELYEEAFAFDLSIAFGSSSDNGMTHRHPSPLEATLRDDAGTTYNAYHRGGGGSEREWRQHYIVTPALNPVAKQLTLEVPRLQIIEHAFRGRGRMQPAHIFLNGPWIITCTVPPIDERISLP